MRRLCCCCCWHLLASAQAPQSQLAVAWTHLRQSSIACRFCLQAAAARWCYSSVRGVLTHPVVTECVYLGHYIMRAAGTWFDPRLCMALSRPTPAGYRHLTFQLSTSKAGYPLGAVAAACRWLFYSIKRSWLVSSAISGSVRAWHTLMLLHPPC